MSARVCSLTVLLVITLLACGCSTPDSDSEADSPQNQSTGSGQSSEQAVAQDPQAPASQPVMLDEATVELADGSHYVLINGFRQVEGSLHVQVDPVEWLTGEDAAAQEPPSEYFVTNTETDVADLPVTAEVVARYPGDATQSLEDFMAEAFPEEPPTSPSYLVDMVYVVEVDGGAITAIEESAESYPR